MSESDLVWYVKNTTEAAAFIIEQFSPWLSREKESENIDSIFRHLEATVKAMLAKVRSLDAKVEKKPLDTNEKDSTLCFEEISDGSISMKEIETQARLVKEQEPSKIDEIVMESPSISSRRSWNPFSDEVNELPCKNKPAQAVLHKEQMSVKILKEGVRTVYQAIDQKGRAINVLKHYFKQKQSGEFNSEVVIQATDCSKSDHVKREGTKILKFQFESTENFSCNLAVREVVMEELIAAANCKQINSMPTSQDNTTIRSLSGEVIAEAPQISSNEKFRDKSLYSLSLFIIEKIYELMISNAETSEKRSKFMAYSAADKEQRPEDDENRASGQAYALSMAFGHLKDHLRGPDDRREEVTMICSAIRRLYELADQSVIEAVPVCSKYLIPNAGRLTGYKPSSFDDWLYYYIVKDLKYERKTQLQYILSRKYEISTWDDNDFSDLKGSCLKILGKCFVSFFDDIMPDRQNHKTIRDFLFPKSFDLSSINVSVERIGVFILSLADYWLIQKSPTDDSKLAENDRQCLLAFINKEKSSLPSDFDRTSRTRFNNKEACTLAIQILRTSLKQVVIDYNDIYDQCTNFLKNNWLIKDVPEDNYIRKVFFSQVCMMVYNTQWMLDKIAILKSEESDDEWMDITDSFSVNLQNLLNSIFNITFYENKHVFGENKPPVVDHKENGSEKSSLIEHSQENSLDTGMQTVISKK